MSQGRKHRVADRVFARINCDRWELSSQIIVLLMTIVTFTFTIKRHNYN